MDISNSTDSEPELSSKAGTLKEFSKHLKKSRIEKLFSFTERDWGINRTKIAQAIYQQFNGQTIIVRSSALGEDNAVTSGAGAFKSERNVDSNSLKAISKAIDNVILSYQEKGMAHPDNLVLVQKQTLDTISSGVVLTRDYQGSPYYVVNYSHGKDTEAVTSGNHTASLRVIKSIQAKEAHLKKLLEAVREIESLVPSIPALDIEYGIKQGEEIVTFQVRPLLVKHDSPYGFEDDVIARQINTLKRQFNKLSQRRSHLAGEVTYFGDMPDWNPAEIIGSSPRPLAASLYHEIITEKVWHKARKSQGYTDVNPAKLVILFGNKPYVDVRCSFNSLIPAKISPSLKEKLMQFYLTKLRKHPEYQDKVEFEILFTCYDLSFSQRSKELVEAGFSTDEIRALRESLLSITNNLLNRSDARVDIRKNEELNNKRLKMQQLEAKTPEDKINKALQLLDICKQNGSLQFSKLARLAFIGKKLLTSLVSEGLISAENYQAFLTSIHTVASDFTIDIEKYSQGKLSKKAFLNKYGHLRPGTYNIEIARYDANDDYLSIHKSLSLAPKQTKQFKISEATHKKISKRLKTEGLDLTSEELFKFVRFSLEAREYSKLLFTSCVSDAIELIASAGQKLGFSREDLSYLDVQTFKKINSKKHLTKDHWSELIAQNRATYSLNKQLALPDIIFSEEDFEVVESHTYQPNYITDKQVTGKLVFLDKTSSLDVTDKIVVLESADPGYDWIFAKNPAGLITKYGGPASHMAIRCAEFGLPAIIGAGNLLFRSLIQSKAVTINCENKKVELAGG